MQNLPPVVGRKPDPGDLYGGLDGSSQQLLQTRSAQGMQRAETLGDVAAQQQAKGLMAKHVAGLIPEGGYAHQLGVQLLNSIPGN